MSDKVEIRYLTQIRGERIYSMLVGSKSVREFPGSGFYGFENDSAMHDDGSSTVYVNFLHRETGARLRVGPTGNSIFISASANSKRSARRAISDLSRLFGVWGSKRLAEAA